jgi:membrane protease YdiL (CAAX protease family)
MAAAFAALAVLALFIIWSANLHIPSALSLGHAIRLMPMALIQAPIQEELLYRLVLCTPLLIVLGNGWTVFISGAIFAALHFVYGNPDPANFVAGYILAWLFIKSGSIIVPILWHIILNSIGGFFLIGNWYILTFGTPNI